MIDGVVKVMESQIRYLKDRVNFYLFVPKAPKGYVEQPIGEVMLTRVKSVKMFFVDYHMATPKCDYKFKKTLKGINLDLVLIHSPFGLGKYGIKYANKNKIPSIIYAHSQIKKDFKRAVTFNFIVDIMIWGTMRRYNKCSIVVPVGEGVKNIYLNEYKMKNKTYVINNATDMKYLNNKNIINEMIDKYQIDTNKIIFSFLGRINKLKGLWLIADSLKIVKDKGLDFQMIFIGEGQDRIALQNYIKEIGLEENTIFTAGISDRNEIAALLQISDLFLFPSLYDTNSLVQIEAASQNTASLLVEDSVTAYGLKDGIDCYLSNYNVNDYAHKIFEVSQSKKSLREMGLKANKNIYRTWEDSHNLLYELMIKLINEQKK
ncbi:MAG: glycosyltransferase [Acholeplasmataceae bacterium]